MFKHRKDKNGFVSLKTPYNPEYILRIKELGAKWDPLYKVWKIPETLVDEAFAIIKEVYGKDSEIVDPSAPSHSKPKEKESTEVIKFYGRNVPSVGKLFIRSGTVYKVLRINYVPEVDDDEAEAWGGCYQDAYYAVTVEDYTDTPEGKALLAEDKAKYEKAKYIAEIKKNIQEAGTPIERVNGYPVPQPAGEVLFDTFNINGTGERIIETPTEYWYLINNGMDGDNWARNTVVTGGAGAYGWRLAKIKK